MKISFLLLALALCARSEENKNEAPNKDKRQTEELVYRTARKQEQVAPVQENQEDDKQDNRNIAEEYRPGQVFSLNVQELLELQPERKNPIKGNQQLQQLYTNSQQDARQNVQQNYYLEPQLSRQVAFQPSHAVIARPHYSSNGGEASVGAALAVSDSGSGSQEALTPELLEYLGYIPGQEEIRAQYYKQTQQTPQLQTQNIAPQYQQVDIPYVPKTSKKPTKLRPKTQLVQAQPSAAPQQYLIETTNVQNHHQQVQQQLVPIVQNQRVPQTLRYVTNQPAPTAVQQPIYERPESQGLKVVPPPKLQQLNPQYNYRIQYQQEATPKQYRIVETPKTQSLRQEQPRVLTNDRSLAYLKRLPDTEKQRPTVSEQNLHESLLQRQSQVSDQYYLRPIYRSNERPRYEISPAALRPADQARSLEPSKTPLSAIYVSKNVAPKKVLRPALRVEQVSKLEAPREQKYRTEQQPSLDQGNGNQHIQSIDEQRARLPPPRNNKAYTQEEFAALLAAGYSVTPIPVGQANVQVAQSRSSAEPVLIQPRRPIYRRQYLPFRGDDAP
ncbi:bromodomain-containing protein DDB_G0280777-like [Danaus plexippus]|uniref:bromodomain-containing protein DDB_G0280777-like n=1 Tax=Danaus plexippus TaxID=13037 RepID=UPI002AB2550C|nr:bromodomain-containing protein DDB_G0280777-like [Danaus plexippus]